MKTEHNSHRGFLCVASSLCLACASFLVAAQKPSVPDRGSPYRVSLPGYPYSFPRDHFNHPDFQTEWWYYTGNVRTADGHSFGFELTFFRQAVDRDHANKTAWDVRDIYLAHFALSDLDGGHFYHYERMNRSGPGIADADEKSQRIWNGNWDIQWKDSDQQLRAITDNVELNLTLHSEKPPVINGENGVSQKSDGAGHASHYISLTRLATRGTIVLNSKSYEITGLSWMDHEFFTHQLAANQSGWDWLSLQLDDRTELMLFHIRRTDGSIDPFSAGTYVDAQGKSTHLRKDDFVLEPLGDTWKSPATNALYPIRWKIKVPRLSIELEASTRLPSQELSGKTALAPTYWEGAIRLNGNRASHPLTGAGYLEMTGYGQPVRLGP